MTSWNGRAAAAALSSQRATVLDANPVTRGIDDLDGDADLDIAVPSVLSNATSVLLNSCNPPMATTTYRNGGSNPASYSATDPVLGALWTGSVDLTITGHSTALFLLGLAPGQTAFPNGQLLLVDNPQILPLPSIPGPMPSWSVAVPSDTSLLGVTLYSQALLVNGVTPFALSNAIDLHLGY